MRTRQEVLERFEDLRSRRLRARRSKYLSKAFMNCRWNKRFRVKGDGKVGFCMHPIVFKKMKDGVFVCNEDCTAKRCRLFDCAHDAESVEEEFEEVLRSPSRCGNEYPKLAILIWFLQNDRRSTRKARFAVAVSGAVRAAWRVVTFGWW